jgi:hypothetical protein
VRLDVGLRWLWKLVLPAAAVFAVLVYWILRQLYATFYGVLGASPEEVGLGYQQMVSLSTVALLAIVLIGGVLVLIRTLLVRSNLLQARHRTRVSIAGAVVAVLILAAGVGWLFAQAKHDAALAYDGQPVTSVNLGGIELLELRAEPASIEWAANPPSGPDTVSGHCLMYLGTADGVSVFFDPGPEIRTIRLQLSEITVTLYRALPQPGGGSPAAACSGGRLQPAS